ncbi:MAG: tetratricopeptide repeat protein, partial [bacterium]|nr:tetratricopeptide repeat protein [bacterium]
MHYKEEIKRRLVEKSNWLRIICLIIFFQYTYVVSGQDKVDSLRQVILNEPVDTLRIEALNLLSQMLYRSEGDSSKIFANRALELSQKIGYNRGIAYSYHNLATNFLTKGEYDSAIWYFEKSLQLKFQLNDLSSASNTLNNIGTIHIYRSDLTRALNYMQRSLKLKLENGDSLSASNNLNNIGIIHNRQKDYDLSLKYHLEALEIRKAYKDFKKQISSLNNIGLVSIEKGNYSDALIYLKQGHKLLDSLDLKCQKTVVVANIGLCNLKLNELDSALKYLERAKDLAIACNTPYNQTIASLNLGELYKKRAFYKKAEIEFLESYRIAVEHNLKLNEKESSEALYNFYRSSNEPLKALKYLEISTQLKDSLTNENLTKQLTSMELNYQFEQERDSLEHQKQTELLVLNAEVGEQKLYKNIMFIGVLILLLVVYLIYRNYQANKLANQYLRKKNELQEQKLQIEERSREQLELDNNQKARALTASSIQLL